MARTILGVDIGAVALSIIELSERGQQLSTSYSIHKGDIREELGRQLERFDLRSVSHIALTGSASHVVCASRKYHPQVACVTAARRLHPGLGALLLVGGEKFSLVRFGEDGAYLDSRFNSSCAAGTGSFLDQQAERLDLVDAAELSRTALLADGDIPKIASRCAVFAKTDLLHAQQDGYSLEAICEGLCRGLAANVFDTLFTSDRPREPIVFAGGVALNRAVGRHLAEMIGCELIIDEHAPVYGALGAGQLLLDDLHAGRVADDESIQASVPQDLLIAPRKGKKTFYPPLELLSDEYPDFAGEESYEFKPEVVTGARPVEVDVYHRAEPGRRLQVALGVDIGSTSTKAVFLDLSEKVLAGFYTRTSGRPLLAIRALFEAVHDWCERDRIELEVVGAATTGAGRKFIGAMIGADLIVDEITAHATAACRLDPQVDTIIEIGGQDAKFTTLSRGTVTQSVMNHVCAAGTGSFIEEQAGRLDCPLPEYDQRTSGRRAPLASDRCTVFMERDINHLLSAGFEVGEVLATVLHSVRENYLTKVARGGTIGERICFQGATAKNRSLVAAFEQQLGKPVLVSRYCHLTGAWGAAALLLESLAKNHQSSKFRGLDLYKEEIAVRSEVCELCNNHCNLRLAEVRGETVAYGFLCGRDYDVQKFVSANRSEFDLLKARRKHFSFTQRTAPGAPGPIVGIPAALYLLDELPMWRKFFDRLGVRTITSRNYTQAVSQGKRLAAAEFCAPMAAFHGHVASLADKADFIFTPIYLEAEHDSPTRRHYCYYSQYAPSLISTMEQKELTDKCLMPLIQSGSGGDLLPGYRLYKALNPALGKDLSLMAVSAAYREARRFFEKKKRGLPELMENVKRDDQVSAVLIGRPYTALAPSMNKLIPDILAKLGVKVFYQDMLSGEKTGEIEDLLKQVHWKYAADMLTAAWKVAKTPGLYPVVISSFMCAPDSCTLEYFRRIMDQHEKPYLILQIDEHDSRMGYETRIEAAVRSFENHLRGARPSGGGTPSLPVAPVISKKTGDKTVLVPPWDTYAVRLFVANLVREGMDARMLDEDEQLIQKSLGSNTGQCIPLNAITQDFIDYIERHDLDPADCILWLPKASMGCNIGFFPQFAKGMLESHGGGFEQAEVYAGETSGTDISMRATINNYFAYFFGGMLRRIGCKLRPYEVRPGATDAAMAAGLDILCEVMRTGGKKIDAAREVVERFLAVEVNPSPAFPSRPRSLRARPQVAIFGDLYARDNDVMNQGLIRTIEEHGGEVLTTPYSEYARIVVKPYLKKWLREGLYWDAFATALAWASVNLMEAKYVEQFERVLGPAPQPARSTGIDEILARFHVDQHHTGESFDNLLKVFHLAERYPKLALFVQTNPAFCCPSLVTEAMSRQIERATGVPVVTVTYDGTVSNKNEVVIPYLQLAREKGALERGRQSFG